MLRELKTTRQVPGDFFRRCFLDDYFDLYLWYDDARVLVGFQLCYDRGVNEHAVTWLPDRGLSHHKVDDGEESGHHPRAPMLAEATAPLDPQVLEKFRAAADQVPHEARELIFRVLTQR